MNLHELSERYIAHLTRSTAKNTARVGGNNLRALCDAWGDLIPSCLRPHHLTEVWSTNPQWNNSTYGAFVRRVKAMMNWAVSIELLDRNPVRTADCPACNSRGANCVWNQEQYDLLRANARQDFRQFLIALWESMARPCEIARLEAKHYIPSAKVCRLDEHKTKKKTAKPRIIYCSDTLCHQLDSLVTLHPTGLLYRQRNGSAWNDGQWGYLMRCTF
jgi:hypothetical protein